MCLSKFWNTNVYQIYETIISTVLIDFQVFIPSLEHWMGKKYRMKAKLELIDLATSN